MPFSLVILGTYNIDKKKTKTKNKREEKVREKEDCRENESREKRKFVGSFSHTKLFKIGLCSYLFSKHSKLQNKSKKHI